MKIPRIIQKSGLVMTLLATLASCSLQLNENQQNPSKTKRNMIPSQTLLEQTIGDVEKDLGITFSSPIKISQDNGLTYPHYENGTIHYPINDQTQDLDSYQVIRHELGHAYVDQIRPRESESTPLAINGKGLNLQEFTKLTPYKDTIDRIIEEGIGEYFEKGVTENGKPLNEFEDNLGIANPYKLGFSLVDPLIDAFGPEAIRYLLHNKPITACSIGDLISYQQEALSQLNY